jgi:hypothetical protein
MGGKLYSLNHTSSKWNTEKRVMNMFFLGLTPIAAKR